jgi:hypothetical protein
LNTNFVKINRKEFSRKGAKAQRKIQDGWHNYSRHVRGGGQGIGANYFEVETGDEHWVSGPTKNGQDRHWAGGGPVQIDEDVAEEYWNEVRKAVPPKNPLVA